MSLAGNPLEASLLTQLGRGAGLLTSLDLSGCGLGDEALAALRRSSHLKRLRSLSLCENPFSLDGILGLLRAPALQGLNTLRLDAKLQAHAADLAREASQYHRPLRVSFYK